MKHVDRDAEVATPSLGLIAGKGALEEDGDGLSSQAVAKQACKQKSEMRPAPLDPACSKYDRLIQAKLTPSPP